MSKKPKLTIDEKEALEEQQKKNRLLERTNPKAKRKDD